MEYPYGLWFLFKETAPMTTALATVASLIYLAGYWAYNSPVLRSDKKPDLVPWTIWGIMGLLNAATYRDVAGNEVMALLNEVGAIAGFVTLIIAVCMRGEGRSLKRDDWIIVGLAACCIIASKLGLPAFLANGFVLAAVTIGIIPIWKKLLTEPTSQKTLPWALWTASLSLNMVVALIEFQRYSELIQPAYYVILHGSVLLMTAPESSTRLEDYDLL